MRSGVSAGNGLANLGNSIIDMGRNGRLRLYPLHVHTQHDIVSLENGKTPDNLILRSRRDRDAFESRSRGWVSYPICNVL